MLAINHIINHKISSEVATLKSKINKSMGSFQKQPCSIFTECVLGVCRGILMHHDMT